MKIINDHLYISADYEKDVSVINLIGKIKYLLDKGFETNKKRTFIVYVGNSCECLKGKYLGKKPLVKIENFNKIRDRLFLYKSKGAKLCMKSGDIIFFKIKLSGDFRIINENSITVNDILIENLNFEFINLVINEENINNIDFDNLNKIKINQIIITNSGWKEHVENFINKYKGYCELSQIPLSTEYDTELCKLFYNSGSMVNHISNLNCDWRMNLFILICHMVSTNENKFQSDLLANPIALIRLAGYLNQR